MSKKQFIVDIVNAKQDANGNYEEPNISALTSADVAFYGDPETGVAHLEKGPGESVEDGEYYAAFYDTFNKRFVGQLAKIGAFTVPGEPTFEPKVDVTASGADVSNAESSATADSSSAAE